jgi:hypothetical protein
MDKPLHHLARLAKSVGGVRQVTYAEASQLVPVVQTMLRGEE